MNETKVFFIVIAVIAIAMSASIIFSSSGDGRVAAYNSCVFPARHTTEEHKINCANAIFGEDNVKKED